ncbi:hypothetical protein ACWFRM_02655 [Streptomyces sp. NPDC055144]
MRRRLVDKLPPEPAPRPPLRVLECATCAAPERPEALTGGRCRLCLGEPRPARPAPPLTLTPETVRTYAGRIRTAMRTR